jgi:hypothetical protein
LVLRCATSWPISWKDPFVQQQVQAFPCGELAFLVLRFNAVVAAALQCLLGFCGEQVELVFHGHALAARVGVGRGQM